MRLNSSVRALLLFMLFSCVVLAQYGYDRKKITLPNGIPSAISPEMIRIVDMGFNPAVSSAFWAGTMPEILDFFHGKTEYLHDRETVNQIDQKMTYPYAFSVLTLPVLSYADRVTSSIAIGDEGLAKGDPDWRIAYYMAINYYLQRKDLKNATWYFNLAANTAGIPQYAARFALNFGINQKERDRVRNLWETVYESTNDPATKARAAAYVERLNDLDALEAAAKIYKQKYGTYPASPDDLVVKKIMRALPEDPFGFSFIIDPIRGTVAIDQAKIPAYLLSNPAE